MGYFQQEGCVSILFLLSFLFFTDFGFSPYEIIYAVIYVEVILYDKMR
jgi:hypothetical protein